MKSVLAVLSLLAVAVSSAPLVFNSDLLEHGDINGRVAVIHHVSHIHGGSGASAERLRFLLLVPTLHKLGELKAFGSQARGLGVKHHDFLNLDDDEHLVDLAGLSDCKTWHGVLVKLWTPTGVLHRAVGGLKENDIFKLHHFSDVKELADFVKGHLKFEAFKGLLEKGVASHHLTHHLHHSFGKLL